MTSLKIVVISLFLICITTGPRALYAQDQGDSTHNVLLTNYKMNMDPPVFEEVTISQLDSSRVFCVGVTQLQVLADTGWRGILWRNFSFSSDNTRPLFDFNQLTYACPVVSEPFILYAGDTIALLLKYNMILPRNLAGTPEDWAAVKFKDSLDVVLSLVSQGQDRLVLLDSTHFIKADSMKPWLQAFTAQIALKGESAGMFIRHVVDSTLEGQAVSVKLDILYHGLLDDRLILRTDGWWLYLPRSEPLLEQDIQAMVEDLCPLIEGCDTLAKRPAEIIPRVISHESSIVVSVFPNPGGGPVRIAYEIEEPADLHFQIYSLQGALVWSRRLTNVQAGSHVLADVATRFRIGSYLCIVRSSSGEYAATLFHIL